MRVLHARRHNVYCNILNECNRKCHRRRRRRRRRDKSCAAAVE